MHTTVNQTPAVRASIIAGGVIAVIFAMRAMAGLVAPFLLAILIAVLVESVVSSLQQRGVPLWAALVIVGGGLAVLGVGFSLLIGAALSNLSSTLPTLEKQLSSQSSTIVSGLSSLGVDQAQFEAPVEQAATTSATFLMSVVDGLGSFVSSTMLVLFYVVLLLLESATLSGKLHAAFGTRSTTMDDLANIFASLQGYLVAQTGLSALVGVLVTLALWLIGVDYPVVWGVLAFLLNYVPNVGPILAAAPSVLLAFIQFGVSTQLFLVIAAYVIIFGAVGSFIYPRVMGDRVGLSPLVVIVAMIVWGWILGPIGLVLSVPLVAAVKIVLGAYAPTRWLAILLGNAPKASA